MKIAIVTGAGGLIGSECVDFFSDRFDEVVGIDNDMRQLFFGKEASTDWNIRRLKEKVPNFIPVNADIRSQKAMESVFVDYHSDIRLVVHCAAQPSHDWAAGDPFTDFTVNANGTLTLLEMTRRYAKEAVFIHCSTNKVYGDTPNTLPLIELENRWELSPLHPYHENGIDETMSIDQTRHSLFGSSKAAADLLVQEYGRYFGMKTACFRGGCLTGPNHSGTMLHGFLSYLARCAITGTPYTIFGYRGKQVRDNIHARDLVRMFWHFYQDPGTGEVYNAGGSRHSNCSMTEAISIFESMAGRKMETRYHDTPRSGDHIWWISDIRKFQKRYPEWHFTFDINAICSEIFTRMENRLITFNRPNGTFLNGEEAR